MRLCKALQQTGLRKGRHPRQCMVHKESYMPPVRLATHRSEEPIQVASPDEEEELEHPAADNEEGTMMIQSPSRELLLQPFSKAASLVLIGSDFPQLIVPTEPVQMGPKGGPVAVHTALGWALQGPVRCFTRSVLPLHHLYPGSSTLYHCRAP